MSGLSGLFICGCLAEKQVQKDADIALTALEKVLRSVMVGGIAWQCHELGGQSFSKESLKGGVFLFGVQASMICLEYSINDSPLNPAMINSYYDGRDTFKGNSAPSMRHDNSLWTFS